MKQLQKLSNELTLRTVAFNAAISKAAESRENCEVSEYLENLHKVACMCGDYAKCLEDTFDRLSRVMQKFEDYTKGNRTEY